MKKIILVMAVCIMSACRNEFIELYPQTIDFVIKIKTIRQNWTFHPVATSKNIFLPLSSLAPISFNLLQN